MLLAPSPPSLPSSSSTSSHQVLQDTTTAGRFLASSHSPVSQLAALHLDEMASPPRASDAQPPLAIALSDIQSAHARIKPYIHRTPLLTSRALDALASSSLLLSSSRVRVRLAFKAEHTQRVGAFKMRGATNATLLALHEAGQAFEAAKLAVVTHSSGNHAAAIACAAKSVGAKAFVVMPNSECWLRGIARQ